MEDRQSSSVLRMNSELSLVASKNYSAKVDFQPESFLQKSLCHKVSKDRAFSGAAGDVAFFVLKVIALETTRRFSRSKCPFAWRSIQACQMLCYPPFKWVQRWAPLKGLVKGIRMFSRPLLVLSIATAFSGSSGSVNPAEDDDIACMPENMDIDSSSPQPYDASNSSNTYFPLIYNVFHKSCSSLPLESWMHKLYEELEKQGIILPERFNKNELRRFYTAANGDFSSLLSSIKKTISWRENFNILLQEELEMWSDLVLWHGYDLKQRPSMIVRLGVACTSLPHNDRPRFAQAIVSQMEHGILHLTNQENPQILVLVDCEGLSPFRLPLQMLRTCSMLFQDHFPNCLDSLFVIRLPPVIRIMVQTYLKVLKPVTRQKLDFLGVKYRKVLSELFQELPACLGGTCVCTTCSSDTSMNTRRVPSVEIANHTQLIAGRFSSDETDFECLRSEIEVHQNFDQVLRTSMIGILMICVFVAFMARLSESSPNLFL